MTGPSSLPPSLRPRLVRPDIVPPAEIVTLSIDGLDYRGWEQVSLSTSLDGGTTSFSATVSERWYTSPSLGDSLLAAVGLGGGIGMETVRPIRTGQSCAVYLGDQLVCTGYITSVRRRYSADGHSVSFEGNSRVADLAACSVIQQQQWRDTAPADIARSLAAPFGIPILSEVPADVRVAEFHSRSGASVYAEITRMCALRAILVSDGPGGSLVLTPAGPGRRSGALRLGESPILDCSYSVSDRDRFSPITVRSSHGFATERGGTEGGAGNPAGARPALEATVIDPAVTRYRPRLIHAAATGQGGDPLTEAQAVQRAGAARSLSLSYSLAGWRQAGPGSPLWWKGQRILVQDPLLGIDQDLLVKSVELRLDGSQGASTAITLADPSSLPMAGNDDHGAALQPQDRAD